MLVFFLLVFDTQIPGPLRFLQTGPKAVCYAWARAADASRVVSCTRCRELRASEISKTQWTTDDNSKSERNDRRLHRVPGHAGYKMVVSVWFRCGFCLMLWVFWWFLSTRLYHYQTLPDYLFLSTQSEHDFLGSSLEMPSEAEDVEFACSKR